MNRIVDLVKKRIKEYKIPELRINFIDREFEVERLLNQVLNMEISWCFVIYGPWGCGKSTFLKALTYALSNVEDVITMYIDLTEEELTKVLYLPKPEIEKEVIKIIQDLGSYLVVIIRLYEFMKKLVEKLKLRRRKFMIIIDEVTKSLEHYRVSIRDFVSSMDKKIHEIVEELNLDRIFPILITSDQTAIEIFNRESGKSISVLMMWHLQEKDYRELLNQLECPSDIMEEVIELSGFCPRIAIDLKYRYGWNLNAWRKEMIEKIKVIIWRYSLETGKAIEKVINEELDPNPDNQAFKPIAKLFIQNNILIFMKHEEARISNIKKREWIGNIFSWQIPIYMKIIELIKEQKKLNIQM